MKNKTHLHTKERKCERERGPTSPNFQKKLYFEPNLANPSCTTLVFLVLWVLKAIFF